MPKSLKVNMRLFLASLFPGKKKSVLANVESVLLELIWVYAIFFLLKMCDNVITYIRFLYLKLTLIDGIERFV